MPKAPAPPTAKRADAQRNITAILDAATACLSRNPEASVGEIARTAGVGRVTLYGHFPSRAELVEAVVARAIDEGNGVLDAVDRTGDARGALVRLIGPSWRQIVRIGAVLVAAEAVLPPGRMRELHAAPARRVEELVERGRAEGVFRSDVPTSWLVRTLHATMHGAAEEIRAGRLPADAAAVTIAATVLAAFTAPGDPVPDPATWASG